MGISRSEASDANGELFLTEPLVSGDFAGVAVRVDLPSDEKFVFTGRLSLKSASGGVFEQKLVFGAIPATGTSSTAISLTELRLSFEGEVGSPAKPVLTNPSSCPSPAKTITTVATSSASTTANASQGYPVTGCSSMSFAPTLEHEFSPTVPDAIPYGSLSVDLPLGHSAIKNLAFKLPPFVWLNAPGYGQTGDRCNASALTGQAANFNFRPSFCPPQAKIGTIEMTTPLLGVPITGSLYLVNRSTLGGIGVALNNGGAVFNIGGVNTYPQVAASCDPVGDPTSCMTQFVFTLYNIPEIPITHFKLSFGNPGRTSILDYQLPDSILRMAPAEAPECTSPQFASTTLVPWSGASPTTLSDHSSISGCESGGDPPSTSLSSGPASVTYDDTPVFAFTSGDSGDTFECKVDGLAWGACSSPFEITAALSSGAHKVKIRSVNAYGPDPSPVVSAFTVDPDVQSVDLSGVEDGDVIGDNSPDFSFTVLIGDSAQCSLDSAAWSDCASPIATGPLPDGEHTFAVRGKSGETPGRPESVEFRVDTTAPETNLISGPVSGEEVASAEWDFSSDEASATFECAVDEGAFVECEPPFEASGLEDGAHSVAIRAEDAAGNVDASPIEGDFIFDSAAPATPMITESPNEVSGISGAEFEFTGDSGSDFECKLDDGEFLPCESPKSYEGLTSGSHDFAVRALDGAGNKSPPAEFSWEIDFINNQCRPEVTESQVLDVDAGGAE